jgi:hypothetical protein
LIAILSSCLMIPNSMSLEFKRFSLSPTIPLTSAYC